MDTQLVGININLQGSPPLAVAQETTQNGDYSLNLQTCMAPTDHENDPDVGRVAAPVAETPVTTFKMAAVVSSPVIKSGLMSSCEHPPHAQPEVAGDTQRRLGHPSESKMAATDLQTTPTSDTTTYSLSVISNSNSQVFGATASTKGPESNLELRKGPFGAYSISSPKMAAKETISRSGGDPTHLAGNCHTNQGHASSSKDARIDDVIHDHVGQGVTSSDAGLEDNVDKDSSLMDTEGEQYGEIGHEEKGIGEKDIDKRQEGWGDTGHLGSRILRQRSNRRPVADRFRQKRQTLQDMARPLKHWLYRHRANPYPTKAEKSQLAVASAMSLTQVSNWFANARRRLKNTVTTPGLSWGRRITLYNSCVEGNAERLSVCDDDGNDGEDQQDTLSSPNHPPPGSPPHSPRYDTCPQGQPGDALGGLLQRYLDDAYERSLQPTDRQRHPSGSLSSHDHDDWSTSSCGSPTRGLDDPMDGLEVIARQLQNVSSDGDDLYLKELSAALALTTLRYRRLSDRHL